MIYKIPTILTLLTIHRAQTLHTVYTVLTIHRVQKYMF